MSILADTSAIVELYADEADSHIIRAFEDVLFRADGVKSLPCTHRSADMRVGAYSSARHGRKLSGRRWHGWRGWRVGGPGCAYAPAASTAAPRMPALLRSAAGTILVRSSSSGRNSS